MLIILMKQGTVTGKILDRQTANSENEEDNVQSLEFIFTV